MPAATEQVPPALIAQPAGRDDGEPVKPEVPELWDDTGELDLSDLSGPESGLDGAGYGGPVSAPLTSEPPHGSLLYTSPSPRDLHISRMRSSAGKKTT
ncbi:hypothetical protein, partial [Streptomyces alkaliphilus]|uniref:hypothetical protein n=1 Tax=Streptomyces alkaliphilus TaxID=1472722 RepID=UPI001E455E34